MKPIHKWNNGNLATLCHQCNCIASLGHTDDLYCKKCNDHRKELLIELMRLDESIGLYIEQAKNEEPKQEIKLEDIFNYEKRRGVKDLIDAHKEEKLEEAAKQYAEIYRCPATNDNEYCRHDIISAINFGAKWKQEQDKKMYSEEDMKSSFQVGFNVGYNDEESPSYLTFEEWIKEYKKK